MLNPGTIVPLARAEAGPAGKRLALLCGLPVATALAVGMAGNWLLGGVMGGVVGLILAVAVSFFDRSRRLTFIVGGGRLEVRGDPMFSDTYALAGFDLARAEIVDLTRQGPRALRWKTCGTAVPGSYYSGEFSLRGGETATVFVSDFRRAVYLPRKNAPALLVSVPDPAAFLELLRAAQR